MASEPVKQDSNSWLGWLIGLLVLLALIFFLVELFADDTDEVQDLNVDIVDQADQFVQDNVGDNDTIVALDVTEDTDTQPTGNNPIEIRGGTITEVVSDRLFRVDTPDRGNVLMYLDDAYDLGESEVEIDLNQGQPISVSGRYTDDLSGQTLEPDESNVVNVERTVFLVTQLLD
jgi:hypothetical protein